MNKHIYTLLGIETGGFILGLTLTDLYAVLGCISFGISIISGILVIILKVIKAFQDKQITDEEIKEIEEKLKELEEKSKDYKK